MMEVIGLALALVAASGCRPGGEVSQGVQLVLATPKLEAGSTLELRFDRPVAPPGQVGQVCASPLRIEPGVTGQYRWLSRRSGVFTPLEPFRLGTAYRITLREGLRDAEGRPLTARLDRVLRTPPFGVMARFPEQPSTNASCVPEVQLFFNASVLARQAAPHLVFRDARGRTVEAEVRQGFTGEAPGRYQFPDYHRGAWAEEFVAQQAIGAHRPWAQARTNWESHETNVVPHFIVAAPVRPLPVGKGWALVVKQGLPAMEWGCRLEREFRVVLGDVRPLDVEAIEAQNALNAGRRVEVRFSKALHPSLTNALENWVEFDPRPADLNYTLEGAHAVFCGSFELNRPSRLTVKAGLPAEEPCVMPESRHLSFVMRPIPPRLYFPETSADQLADGRREFRLLAVNLPRVRVRAKQMEETTAIHALRGYRSYFRGWRWGAVEPYKGVDYNQVPGRTVHDATYQGSVATDQPATLVLRWDDLIQGRRHGVIFIEAGPPAEPGEPSRGPATQAIIQLTDLGLVWKSAGNEIMAFVFSHATGQPVPGVTLQSLTEENVVMGAGQTDQQGVALFQTAAGATWLMARKGEDLHAVELGGDWRQRRSFFVRGPEYGPRDWGPRGVFLFSERTLYRAGETLHLKAIVRETGEHGRLVVPAAARGRLRCLDPRERCFFETNITFSTEGSWDISLELPRSPLGDYTAELVVASNTYTHQVRVRDYQPNAFELRLRPKPVLGAGEAIEVPFDVLLVFSTNLTPHSLGDEAFFRRIRHKVQIPDPTEQEFRQILELFARRSNVPLDPDGVEYLISNYYHAKGRPFRSVHPRDILALILDAAKYQEKPPRFDRDSIDEACATYFVQASGTGESDRADQPDRLRPTA